MKIAGLDIGTTGCKCTVFDEQGKDLGKAYRDYPVRRAVGSHEIDVSAVMEGVYAVIRKMSEAYPDIGGLGVTSFGETFVLTDGEGNPLHPAMLYTDPRGSEECRELTERLGAESIARITGLRPHEMYSICKLMWIKKHRPSIWHAARHVFQMEDYVVFHLTGKAQIDYVYDAMPDMDRMYKGYFSIVPYVVPGTYVAYAFSYTGGALIQWCAEKLAGGAQEQAQKLGLSVNELLERTYLEKGNAGPGSLLVLPHFAGAATPYMDTGSRGVILGLTTESTAADIYRGCMEGVAYEMYLNYQALAQTGIHFEKLHATGGGARSAVWMQMKADVLNLPITALKTMDAGTVGSAMLTGVAIGVFRDLKEAAEHMVEKTVTYMPRQDMHEQYMQVYERYCRIYEAVRPLV